MTNRVNQKWLTVLGILIVIITLGIIIAITMNDNSETEIIGQKDVPTDIWIGEDVD